MFLADLPGFKNPLFLNFKKKFFLAHPGVHCWYAYRLMLLLDAPHMMLLMQRLGQQTTKLLISTVSPLFFT